MARKILHFSTNNFPEPLLYFWRIYIIIINPFLFASIVWGIYVNTFYFTFIIRK